MSNITIHQRHPLKREGTNRVSMLLQALTPAYFKLDDRSMQDLIVAAHRYAQTLSYFNEQYQPEGDWSAFWEVESLTYLAVLASLDTEQLRKKYEDIDLALAEALETYNPAKGKPSPIPGLYRDLLDVLFEMAKGLEVMYGKLVQIKHPMQQLLLNIIKRDNQCDFEELEGALQRLVSLHKGADDHLQHDRYNIFNTPDDRWGIPDRKHYDLIKPNSKVTREKLRALFITFFNAYLIIIHRGQQAFDAELALMDKPEDDTYRIVEPHISLFLTFLRLFRHAQDSLNELTQKQLDYYYENILCLHRRGAEPDHVHLIFTLAKNFEQELIEKGTLLIGGKDKNGQPMYYETLKDWVVTQAQVKEVKTVFVPKRFSFNDNDLDDLEKYRSLLAADFLPDGETGHRPFGDDKNATEAEIGFAVCSPQLWLAEGNRWIEMTINNLASPLFNEVEEGSAADNLAISVSTKDGWKYLSLPLKTNGTVDNLKKNQLFPSSIGAIGTPIPLDSTQHIIQACYGIQQNGPNLSIQIFLPADFDALEPVEGNPMSHLPGIKLVLKKNQFESLSNPYLKFLNSKDYPIYVSVRAEGVSKNLILQSDSGLSDGTQQVLPFGPNAAKGSKFYLGSWEAFLKRLNEIRLNIDWVGAASIDFTAYPPILYRGGITARFLYENSFENIGFQSTNAGEWSNSVLSGTTMTSPLRFVFNSGLKRGNHDYKFSAFDYSVRRGFMQFKFDGDFGHKDFSEILAVKSIAIAKYNSQMPDGSTASDNELPNPPYTPTFNSIKMDYISLYQEMEHGVDDFFYLHPFEGHEKRPFFEKVKVNNNPPALRASTLFPDYTRFNGFADLDGHLLIGLSDLKAGSNLSLLVHNSEGSERDADRDIPKLHWSYLKKNNEWAPISPLKVIADTPAPFTKSCVIQVGIPEDISSEGNTLLNPKLLWLRVLAEEGGNRNAAALPDLLNLRTQVIEAALRLSDGLEPVHLVEGQPPSSISKLALSRSSVKKVEQLATTFGGRETEQSGLSFYRRISEQLRHRNRAILAWDYEHLLLEKFADIATAKCVNHTQYKITQASELAPGFVTVAVIPDLRKRAGTSLENPRFPKGYLDEMRDFLNEHANLFLDQVIGDYKHLQVVNPQYEPLQVTLKVKFRLGVDEAFYKQKLSDDLKIHIAPWMGNPDQAPVFGRYLRRSGLVRFVEERSYIDYIIDLKVTKTDPLTLLGEDIRPSTAHGILTTAAEHSVNK